MGSKHIVESLVEANKNITKIADKIENEEATPASHQVWVDDLNSIISQLDHIVEQLEKNG